MMPRPAVLPASIVLGLWPAFQYPEDES